LIVIACLSSGKFFMFQSFIRNHWIKWNFPPWYNWNIVENGIKYHNPNPSNGIMLLGWYSTFCVVFFPLSNSTWLPWLIMLSDWWKIQIFEILWNLIFCKVYVFVSVYYKFDWNENLISGVMVNMITSCVQASVMSNKRLLNWYLSLLL
jgi:hypothetical protein